MARTPTICVPADLKKSVYVVDEDTRALSIRKDGTPCANFVAGFNIGGTYVHAMVWTSDDASRPATRVDGLSNFGLSGSQIGITLYGDSYITSVNAPFGGAELSRKEIESIVTALTEARTHLMRAGW